MSLDDLRADIKRATSEAEKLAGNHAGQDADPDRLASHLQNTLWPFLDGLLDHLGEMGDDLGEIDEAVAELVDHEEDYLQPDTAAVFAGVIQGGRALAAELRDLMAKAGIAAGTVGAERIEALIDGHEQMCQHGMAILGEITMVRPDSAPADEPPKDGEDE